ncbi:MAG: hypothetical protein AAGD32_08995 [Planctomycetota bacterium]
MADADFDVLILGDHPSAAFLALLLAGEAKVLRAARPTEHLFFAEQPTLEVLNPAAARLHPLLGDLPNLTPMAGVCLLGPDAETHGLWHADEPQALALNQQAFTQVIDDHASKAGAVSRTRPIEILGTDRGGVRFKEGATERRATLMVVTDPMPDRILAPLGLHARRTSHTLMYRAFGNDATADLPEVVAGLDLVPNSVARLLVDQAGKPEATLFVPTPTPDAEAMMDQWCERLGMHGLLEDGRPGKITRTEVALGGALGQDMVGDRTLLIGPAGGFVSEFGESLYPGLWSATFAAESIRLALSADYPQEPLQAFRGTWGATLGNYLRGPQQNLPFLLPLIYSNQAMMARLGRAMLLGEALVH